jgi:hypothetical protein
MLVLLALFLAAPGGAAPVPTHLMEKDPGSYYPTRVGATWVYQRPDGSELTEVVSSVEDDKDGAKLVTVEFLQGERKFPGAIIRVSKQGLSRPKIRTSEYTEPFPLLKLPARVGDKWEYSVTFKPGGTVSETGTKTIGEPVEIEAGGVKYKTIHVITKSSNNPNEIHSYYAPGVGLIKQTGSGEVTLKSFTPGKN